MILIAGLVFLALCTLTLRYGQEQEERWRPDEVQLLAHELRWLGGDSVPAPEEQPALLWQARQRRLAQRLGQQQAGQRAAAAGHEQAATPGAGDSPRGLQPPLGQAA